MDRQARYNIQTSTGLQDKGRYKWAFLIVDTLSQIEEAKEFFFRQLEPVEYKDWKKDSILSSRTLYYDFFSIESEKRKIEESGKIYIPKIFMFDKKLPTRNGADLENYLTLFLKGRK